MKKVIFILSVGHSGSTLLDISLGQFRNSFSTGELKHLTWQYFREIENWPSKQKCTCGENFDDCEIWPNVIKYLANFRQVKPKEVPIKVPIKHFDSLFFTTNYKKDKILRYIYKKNLYYNLIPKSLYHLIFKKINENNVQLYKSIFKLLPEIDYIIDSSKDIIKYVELSNKIDAFPIVLIRDINEVMNSKWVNKSEKKVKSWQRYYNQHVLPIIKSMSEEEYHIVSYEKFIDNPNTTILELAKKITLDVKEFNMNIPMDNYHVVAGGGMRYTDIVTIRQKTLDEEKLKRTLSNAKLNNFFIDQI